MDIVSITKFLKPGKPKPEDCARFLQLLLQGISLHAPEADEMDLRLFRQEIAEVSDRLSEQSSSEEILSGLASVIRAMSDYNRKTVKVTQAHLGELQAMLAMTTETIAFLSASSKTGVEQLQTVERNLRKASSIDDVRELRSKLDACLAILRDESKRLSGETEARIEALRAGVERSAKVMRSAESHQAIDPVTGWHGRGAAEDLIGSNIAQGRESMVALFVVDRLAYVNGRFGRRSGDEVLLTVAQHVGQRLESGSLFRWSGPALAAIVEIQPSLYMVERKMKQIASLRLEKSVETDGRSVLFAITCSYLLQKASPADSAEMIFRNLDKFVATHAGETAPVSGPA